MALSERNLRRIQESLNDILECGVCKDVFEDARMLPCVHSFCLKCLKEMPNTCTGNSIICPICRREFPLCENGVEGLPKNFFLVRIRETMQIVNSTSNLNGSCGICHKDSTAGGVLPVAEVYCCDCKKRLCSKCCISHIRNASDRKHTLMAISDNPEHKVELEPNASIFCDTHKQHPINIYCLKCREVLCAMCYIEKHLNHEQKLITDASQIFRDQIQQSVTRLSPNKDILRKTMEELENGKSAIRLETMQLEEAIIDVRDAIVRRANEDARCLLFMLSMTTKKKQKDVQVLMGDVTFKYSRLDSYSSFCNELSRGGSDIDICHGVHWLETRSNELQQSTTVDHLSSDIRFQMVFKKTDLGAFMAQSNVIGELNEVENCDKPKISSENENVTEVEDMDSLNVKQQISGSCQPQVLTADVKDNGSATDVYIDADENISDTRIRNDSEDPSTPESEGTDVNIGGLLSSTEDEAVARSLESSLERSDDGSTIPARNSSRRSSLLGWMFSRKDSGGDISETDSRSRQSSESEDNEHVPLCIHTIKTKSSKTDTHLICGITVLHQELYVVSDESSTVTVYDTKTFTLLRELRISRLVDPADIASCHNNSCIYIVDWKSRDRANEILKVDAAGTVLKKWTTPDDYSWISVTYASNIVLTLHEENTINEYKPNGIGVHSVKISPRSGVYHLWHAIKLTNGNFIVSHGLKDYHRVCQVGVDGTVTNSFGADSGVRRLKSAVYLAEDSQGSILVVDESRGCVVQLHSNLEFQKQIFMRRYNMFSPVRIHLDASSGRLFVADRKCLISVFKFC